MKREVAVKITGNFRRVCPINGRQFKANDISVWDIAVACGRQSKQNKREYLPMKIGILHGIQETPGKVFATN
jgi:hypothetical protein